MDLAQRGDGRVRGVLSVDVSEWQRPGRRTGKVAQLCTPEEIFTEVWGQLEDHLDGALDVLTVIDRFLDPAIVFPNPTGAANLEPLLVNTAGSWADRPDAVTRIGNLFLASDYVRTHTDLATMEAANEAARRAVNGSSTPTGSNARRCEVWRPPEPRRSPRRACWTACAGSSSTGRPSRRWSSPTAASCVRRDRWRVRCSAPLRCCDVGAEGGPGERHSAS